MLEGFHLGVARIAGRALEPHGFALGGGYALQAHGVTDRPSKDLDSYTESQDPSDYQAGEDALVSALSQAGFDCRVERRDSWFRQIVVTDRASGEQVGVDLGYDYRLRPPVRIDGIGPVLDLNDVIVGKTRALLDRRAERDYFDIDRIIASSLRSPSGLYVGIQPIRPEISRGEFARVLELAHEGDPDEYAALGLSPDDMLALFERLAVSAQSLRSEIGPTNRTTQSPSAGDPSPSALPESARRCRVCGRRLRSPESIARGYGRTCAHRI